MLTKTLSLFPDLLLSLRLEGEETLKYRCGSWPPSEKFRIVSNGHRRDFCVSFCKTNFTEHHTPDTIHCRPYRFSSGL